MSGGSRRGHTSCMIMHLIGIARLEMEPVQRNENGQSWTFSKENSGPDSKSELGTDLLPAGEKASLSSATVNLYPSLTLLTHNLR